MPPPGSRSFGRCWSGQRLAQVIARPRRRKQQDDGVGQGGAGVVADHIAGELLRIGEIGDGEAVGHRREMPRGAGELEEIMSGNVLHEVAVLEVQLRGDGPGRGVEITGHIEVGYAADDGVGAIRQGELLHQPVRAVNHAIGVKVGKLLDDHGFPVRQPADLQREDAAIGVADGGGRVGERGGDSLRARDEA